ncbi:hypothetical protein AAE485_04075 [Acidithiobacillus ferriphilus]|jgi:hypothetical protein|uniref:hypothetical protein n=1 Tax=Acidithiobacillus ferriphilus TaxID=1689834 RepID=UPI00390CAF4D
MPVSHSSGFCVSGHHLFDTLYHALALLHPEAVLVTADRRYFVKAQREDCIILLEDFYASKNGYAR